MFAKLIFILFLFYSILLIISELQILLDKYTSDFSVKSLSIKNLQIILRYRGISYEGAFEKKELINLVEETGQTSQYEWKSAKSYKTNEGKCNLITVSTISNEEHFKELVEDNKNSVWILMTITPTSLSSTSDEYNRKLEQVWCHVQSVYAQYGFNMAVLDCASLYNLCWNRGFRRAPFVLMLPHNSIKMKGFEDFFVFVYSNDVVKESVESVKKSVVDWIKIKMTHRFNQQPIVGRQIDDPSGNRSSINFISIYSSTSGLTKIPPTSILAHSVKLAGQITFWSGTLSDIPSGLVDKIRRELPDWKPPGHFFIGYDDLIYRYDTKPGQSISYDSMQLFFQDVCPDSNDILKWSFSIVILIVSIKVAMLNAPIANRLFYLIYLILFVALYYQVFISVVKLVNYAFLRYFSFYWQKFAISSLFQHIRYLRLCNKLDWPIIIIVWWFIVIIVVSKFRYQQEPEKEAETLQNESFLESQNFQEAQDFQEHEEEVEIFQNQSSLINVFPGNNWVLDRQDSELDEQINVVLENFHLRLWPQCDLSNLFTWSFTEPEILPSDLGIGALPTDGNPSWPKGYIFTDKCSICLEKFQQDDQMCGLPCKHSFHERCIKKWLVQEDKDNCPQCRWPVYEEKP